MWLCIGIGLICFVAGGILALALCVVGHDG